jgi:peptidoglycan/xylan/chitin deacetylase (PgdA/CDA1 family)
VDVPRRTVLKAALAVAAAVAVGDAVEGCDTSANRAVPTTPTSVGSAQAPETSPTPAPPTTPAASGSSGGTTAASASAPAASASVAPSISSSASSSAVVAGNGPAVEIVHGPATAKGVALTFHGAGDPALALQLLSAVHTAGASITVLAVGTWLEQNPTMAKRILDAGHELGNHTYHHLTMPNLDSAADDTEITKCAQILRTLTGSQGRWFRPSGTTRATPRILAAAGRAGYAECLSFDVDPQDYTDPGAAAVVARLLAAVRPGSIVSLHLGHAGTVQAMPAILQGLQSRGLPAVSMSMLMAS